MATVAHRSFGHTNHFDKIVLLGDETGGAFRLVLNLWRPPYTADQVADGQIHNHRCEFWSTILFGSLRASEFERHESGEPYVELRYRPALNIRGEKRNEYRILGQCKLRRRTDVEWSKGMTYHLPRDRIHRIVISDEPTATLLLRGPHEVVDTSIFARRPYEDMDLPALRIDELRDDLEFSLKMIR